MDNKLTVKTRMTKVALKIFKPMLKNFAKDLIEDNKEIILDTVKKIDIPKMTKKEEAKLIDDLYTSLEEAAVTIIDRI